MSQWIKLGIAITSLLAAAPLKNGAQSTPTSANVAIKPPLLPITSQIKKTVVFLDTSCVHDFNVDAGALTNERLGAMPAQQKIALLQQLFSLTMKLQSVPQSIVKLDKDEQDHLKQQPSLDSNDPSTLVAETLWRLGALIKMTTFTSDDIARMTPEHLKLIPADDHRGTGFFVKLFDPRIRVQEGIDKSGVGFVYLVTNRHVAEPGIENGKPCQVLSSSVMLNRKPDSTHTSTYTEVVPVDKIVKWVFSTDDSVDLAVSRIGVPPDLYDYITIPTDQFITQDDVGKKTVVEGDPVLFSGLFIQSFNEVHSLEPIVRSGTLAMIPEGTLETTLDRKPGHIYLAEAHAFGGNSGSPVFVDTARFANALGLSYKFLGVISGEVFENADLTLNVTATLSANVGANSDVSVVVPAAELLNILNGKELQSERDSTIANQAVPIGGAPAGGKPK